LERDDLGDSDVTDETTRPKDAPKSVQNKRIKAVLPTLILKILSKTALFS
jgi:hypothetical protein